MLWKNSMKNSVQLRPASNDSVQSRFTDITWVSYSVTKYKTSQAGGTWSSFLKNREYWLMLVITKLHLSLMCHHSRTSTGFYRHHPGQTCLWSCDTEMIGPSAQSLLDFCVMNFWNIYCQNYICNADAVMSKHDTLSFLFRENHDH